MATKKKTTLRAIPGGKKTRKTPGDPTPVYAANRPLIQIVLPAELSPEKGLRAEDYIHRTYHENRLFEAKERETEKLVDHVRGRSRVYPEINVLNSAKAWYQRMIRQSRGEGYTDVKKFFKESANVNKHDKMLFDSVGALIEWENKLRRGG